MAAGNLKYLIGIVAGLFLVAVIFAMRLSYVAGQQAKISMGQLSIRLRGREIRSVNLGDIFGSSAESKFRSTLAGVGSINSVKWSLITCQLGGRPCVGSINMLSQSRNLRYKMYFYDGKCLSLEQIL